MNKKIIDVLNNLNPELDLSDTYEIKQIKPSEISGKTTNDILKNLEDKDISGLKSPVLLKKSTKNFDSVTKNNKIKKDIDISNKPTFLDNFLANANKIRARVKHKVNSIDFTSNKPVQILNKKNYFTKKFIKNLGLFIVCIIILLIIDKNIVENKINSGYEKLITLKDNSGNIEFIENQIQSIKKDFELGNILFKPFLILQNQDIDNGYNVLKGGLELTNVIEKGLKVYKGTTGFIEDKGGLENIKLTNLLFNLKGDFSSILSSLYNSIIYYNNIKDLPNKELNLKLEFAKSKLIEGYKFLDLINKDYDIFLGLLGHNSERKYLILFQNNDEIRATGGFIGSLATVTIKNGMITDFAKEDVYSYEWDINKVMTQKEAAPEGLNKITETFGFRDSNYFISFEASSNSIKSFLDKVDRHIDGIIYINQNTVLDFLKYTGGIEFEQLGETITQDNFSLIISTLVEANSFKVGTLGTPKQILFDFSNKFISILKEKKDYYAYLDIIIKNIKSRDLVIYSFNPEENNLLWKLGLNGKINYLENIDFAYPVYTSVGGNKSDRYIQLKYKKNIEKNADCSIDTNLSIYRTHMFSKFEEQKVNELLDRHPIKSKTRQDIINIQGKGDNKSYIRVLLPKDAIIEEKAGINTKKFDNFTLVDFYQTTRLLESTHYDIDYKLPNTECRDYSYKLYKQSGVRKYDIEIIQGEEKVRKVDIEKDFIY